jgi:hypothetical protein
MNAEPDDHYTALEPLPDLGEQTGVLKNACGICKENYTCRGERNMCALACSHTLCLTCAKGVQEQGAATNTTTKCPYCRTEVKKFIVLRYDPPEEAADDDDEPIVIPMTAARRAAAQQAAADDDDEPIVIPMTAAQRAGLAAAQRAAAAGDDEPLMIASHAVDID